VKPQYPIMIPSKGRATKQLTSRTLDRIGVPHYIIVEPQELEEYTKHKYPLSTLLVLPVEEYRAKHDTTDDLGDSRSYGAGPARNFAWDYSMNVLGAPFHHDVDDNIDGLYRLNYNLKTPVVDGSIIRAMEAFVERYDNVATAGPMYYMFAARRQPRNPFVLNTRIYSWTLIRNDIPFRWRGRLNEDTDLSLRVLKAGWCTIQFVAFLQNKMTTQQMKGGYNDQFYAAEGTMPKSEWLVKMHPDVARITWRFHRWHHYVDYSVFKQPLHRKEGLVIPEGTDNFGMILERYDLRGEDWVQVRSPWEGLPDRPVDEAPPVAAGG
jgi:hypothetical protein